MKERSSKYMYDILDSIRLVEQFLSETNSFTDYTNDLKTKNAVERQLSIIGEALNKLLKEEPEIQITDSKDIVNFRNRLVHAYDNIDDSIVWAIKTKHLPILKKEITELLSSKK